MILLALWMILTLCFGQMRSPDRLELELNCSRLLRSLQPEILIPTFCLSFVPEPLSELIIFLFNSLHSRFCLSNNFIIRMFWALITCIISLLIPKLLGSSDAKSVQGTYNLRKADPRGKSSNCQFRIVFVVNQLVTKIL